jgi:hypothetical protein
MFVTRNSSSFVDAGEPSKAPRQDIGEQGMSNRLAEEEHAFADSDEPRPEPAGPTV